MRVRSSSRFLTRMRFGLRSVGARAVRTVEDSCAATSANKNARGSEPGHLTTPETGRPRFRSLTRGASFPVAIVSRIAPPIRDILKTQTRRANPDNVARLRWVRNRACNYRTNVCQNRVDQLWAHTLAVKYPCDASRARAADDSIGGPQMLKFLNALAALAAVGTFVIAFLDSYEVRIKVRRRTRGADGRRHLRRNKRK